MKTKLVYTTVVVALLAMAVVMFPRKRQMAKVYVLPSPETMTEGNPFSI